MICIQLKTADQEIDMKQGDFHDRYNFYMDYCVISPSVFLLDTIVRRGKLHIFSPLHQLAEVTGLYEFLVSQTLNREKLFCLF